MLKEALNKGISTPVAITVILILVIVVGGLAWWQCSEINKKAVSVVVKKSEEPLTLEKLKNSEYLIGSFSKEVEFLDGSYEETVEEGEIQFKIIAGLYRDLEGEYKVVFGDLNGDNVEDAAVVIYSNTGGTGTWVELAVILNKNGEPYFLDSELLGDRTKVNSVKIEDKKILLDVVMHGPEDPMCCPTLEKALTFELKGNKIMFVLSDGSLTETIGPACSSGEDCEYFECPEPDDPACNYRVECDEYCLCVLVCP